jgi:cation:H+ antiporter
VNHKHTALILLTASATLPGVILRLAGIHLEPTATAAISGAAIAAAAFLLLWACDAAQTEISQALALAAVALMAVLPEYSIDMYFTWQAGQDATGAHAQYAVANMTGANRLLIGVGWGAVALLYWLRFRKPVRIGEERRTELLFLGAATAYAFVIPLKGTLAWYDGMVFLGLYAWYVIVAGRRCCEEPEIEGPAELLARLPRGLRRLAIAAMFLFAGGVILANSEPFCESLIATGKALRISEFVLVQWLAPVASEAPEFVVALVFAWRGQAGMALGSLLSAKLNQWTLLVGMIPGVFAISHGTLEHPIPMSGLQMNEIMLTAAQSLLGVLVLAGLRLSGGGALLLFGLFAGQLVLPVIAPLAPALAWGLASGQIHTVFSMLYLTSAATLIMQHPHDVRGLLKGASALRRPECATCEYRQAGYDRAARKARSNPEMEPCTVSSGTVSESRK